MLPGLGIVLATRTALLGSRQTFLDAERVEAIIINEVQLLDALHLSCTCGALWADRSLCRR